MSLATRGRASEAIKGPAGRSSEVARSRSNGVRTHSTWLIPSRKRDTAVFLLALVVCAGIGVWGLHEPTLPSVPEGMVWIAGGEFWMGSDVPMFRDAQPVHRVSVEGFFIDKTEVTNEQFEAFVKATGYVTIAERKPTKEEFPEAPPENLVAGSTVFTPTLVLDAHFTPEEMPQYKGWGHSDWRRCAEFASENDVAGLWLFHHKPGRTDEELVRIRLNAQRVFRATETASEGDALQL